MCRRRLYAPEDCAIPHPMLHPHPPQPINIQGTAQVQQPMMSSSLMTNMASSVPTHKSDPTHKFSVPSSSSAAAPLSFNPGSSSSWGGGGEGLGWGGGGEGLGMMHCGSGSGSGPMMAGGILGYGPLSSSLATSSLQGANVSQAMTGMGLGGGRTEDQANSVALAALALKHQQAQVSQNLDELRLELVLTSFDDSLHCRLMPLPLQPCNRSSSSKDRLLALCRICTLNLQHLMGPGEEEGGYCSWVT